MSASDPKQTWAAQDFGRRIAGIYEGDAGIYEGDCELFHDTRAALPWIQEKIGSIDRSYQKIRARVGTERAEKCCDC